MHIGIIRNFAAEIVIKAACAIAQDHGMQVKATYSGYTSAGNFTDPAGDTFDEVDHVIVLLDLALEFDKRGLRPNEVDSSKLWSPDTSSRVVRQYLNQELVRLNIPVNTRITCVVVGQGLVIPPSFDRITLSSQTEREEEINDSKDFLRKFQIDFLATNDIIYRFGAESLFDHRLRFSMSMPFTQKGITQYSRLIAERLLFLDGKGIKCIVVDLDNTLWGGILDEVGASGISLGATMEGSPYVWFQRQLKRLSDQGMRLAIASKNDESEVRRLFKSHPSMELEVSDFHSTQVNWDDKAFQITQISDDLKVLPQNMLFVDDSEREIRAVKAHHPDIHVLKVDPERPSSIYTFFWQIPALDIRLRDQNRASAARERVDASGPETRQTANTAKGPVLTIRTATTWDLARLEEMARRTNQFNSDGIRTSRAEFAAWLSDVDLRVRICSLEDDVGELGDVGFSVFMRSGDSLTVSKMALSCRAFGHGIEFAMLTDSEIISEHSSLDREFEMKIVCVDTGKNGRFLDFIRRVIGSTEDVGDSMPTLNIESVLNLLQKYDLLVRSEPLR